MIQDQGTCALDGGLRVLTFTSLFPNAVEPNFCGFIPRRMEPWAARYGRAWAVVAPVPFFPPLPVKTRWSRYSSVPRVEYRSDFRVDHPRYPHLPKVGARMQGGWMAVGARRAVGSAVRRMGGVDVMDAHFVYPDGYAAMLLSEAIGCPFVVSARGSDINLYPDFAGIRPKIHRVLKAASAVIGVSKALVDRMIALGAEPDKCHVVPNGVDLDLFSPRASLREAGKIRMLAAGNLVAEKGFDLLLDALVRVIPEIGDVVLTIAGDGGQGPELKEQAERLGLGGRVRFVGRVEHARLADLFRESDVFCLSSRVEGCPNVVMEALASGVPVVATPVGGVPELVRDGENGVLADAVNAEGIARALARICQLSWNPERVRSSVAGRSWSATAQRLQQIFASIVGFSG